MALSLVVVDPVSTTTETLGRAAGNVASPERVAAFEDNLRWQYAQADNTTNAASDAPAPGANPPVAADPNDASERARRTLDLGAPETRAGDMILDGIQKLRSKFDAGQERVGAIMQSQVLDANTMLALQVELVNYTMLIDITSKLTGKTTQAFDTLMKGQ